MSNPKNRPFPYQYQYQAISRLRRKAKGRVIHVVHAADIDEQMEVIIQKKTERQSLHRIHRLSGKRP